MLISLSLTTNSLWLSLVATPALYTWLFIYLGARVSVHMPTSAKCSFITEQDILHEFPQILAGHDSRLDGCIDPSFKLIYDLDVECIFQQLVTGSSLLCGLKNTMLPTTSFGPQNDYV